MIYKTMKTRNADETIASILHAAVGGITKTKIMYKSFITYDQLNEYLSVLIEKGLIEYKEGERIYHTTAKGILYLEGNENSNEFNKVLVIGLGQLGLPVARYVKEKGFDAYGYDISSNAMDRAEKTAGIKKAKDFSDFDVYILCVSTHKPDDIFTPQIEGLLSIVRRISKEATRNGALVSIESTIPKGTSAKVLEILNHRLHVAHAPHRWYALEEKEHGVNQLRVVGGVCDCCLDAAMRLYNGVPYSRAKIASSTNVFTTSDQNSSSIIGNKTKSDLQDNPEVAAIPPKRKSLEIPMYSLSNIETAELTKIAENAHRYLQIAFAEDLYLYCQANNLNFSELRDALNTKWNVNVLEPREGIGGHCLPKDTRMFLESSKSSIKSKILTAAMEVDEDYRKYRESTVHKKTKTTSSTSAESAVPAPAIAPPVPVKVTENE
jgi:UDP-N-acetyl-D-mannosaminuronic acid dehydrogenase